MIIPFKKQNNYYGFLILVSILTIIIYYRLQLWDLLLAYNSMRLMIAISIIFLLYVLFLLFLFFRLFKQNMDIELNSFGIIDNSNITKIGLIKWKDISMIRLSLGKIDKTLLVYLSNSNAYLEKLNHNFFIEKVLQQNKKIYGTCFA